MRCTKTFLLLLVLLFGPFISLGKYVEESSVKKAWRDEAEETDDSRLIEDEGEEEEEEEYDRDEREEEEQYNRDDDKEEYEQEERDAREEVVHILGQSSEEPLQEEANDDDDEDKPSEFDDDEEEEVDNLQDDRMMDEDEGGMVLAGQTEDVPDQTGFEGFKRKVEEINKANEKIQAEINKLKVEFDKALSSDSNNGAPDFLVDTQHVTSSSVIKAREDTAEDTKSTGVQQRTYDEGGLIRQHSEMGEDANLAPDEDY